jgi:hypothetical protein
MSARTYRTAAETKVLALLGMANENIDDQFCFI